MKNTVAKHGHPPKSSKPQETVAKSSSKAQAKVSKSLSKAKPLQKNSLNKSLPENVSKSSQKNSLKQLAYYYKDKDDDAEISQNQRNIQNNDNEDNNNASSSSKSSRSQNEKNVTFEDETDNASTSHIATNILDILPEDNNGDNDDSQQNDNYSISSNEHNNYEEFQSANSLIAISSNEYEEEFQSGISANQMYTLSSSSIENIGTFNESSMPSSAILSKINNNRDGAHIWDEEIKCLFLKARFPPTICIDEFVKKIFGYPPYSKEGTEIQTKTKNTLSDFWHRFNQTVLDHVKNYKEIQERQGVTSLTNKNINNYINEKVTMDVLHRFIGGTNQSELKRCDAVKKLVQLIHGMFKIHWQSKNIDQVKNLDNLTKNMHVLSRSGLDIASKLNLNL
ncbi:hypothetical protein F8M41_024332 [Gigaspora margarita]|uniref:Uncharacterized protein n=1 Tax=Gigaspora margarita TaxID=4874 RepID=A0A8H3XL86_GIGMA|nr:hypothetical protein F8M41_024332 [Gigaspora margarita]